MSRKKKSDIYGGLLLTIVAFIAWLVKVIIDVVETIMEHAVSAHSAVVSYGLTSNGAVAIVLMVLFLIALGCFIGAKRWAQNQLAQFIEQATDEVNQKLEEGRRANQAKEQRLNSEKVHWFELKRRADKSFQRLIDSAYKFKVKTLLSGLTLKNEGTKLEQLTKEKDKYTKLIDDMQFLNLIDHSDWTQVRCDFYLKLDQLRLAQEVKEEQAELKRLMREEKQRQDELERRQREAVEEERRLAEQQRLVEEALLAAKGLHRDELERQRLELEQQIQDVHAQYERAKSMAQLTKQGHVYVISNIGSFGENIFKVGMTRRLEPMDRVKELGDASVPFEFDVHAMISCDDAPALEKALHNELERYRVNKVNLRKEFFNVDLNKIMTSVERHHGTIEYVVNPVALQYYKTLELNAQAA
ncbi:GIY-YIG nuclease family protein [Vibrio parahaemolyticus]|uniref:GIY-YIG nuclease family protein n=1 Tax=Vibrio owensii TaxID=696485 RepID=UPI002A0228BB|nr:GIY-YIG nuclease family protein [Vibrio parahaemolyticus]